MGNQKHDNQQQKKTKTTQHKKSLPKTISNCRKHTFQLKRGTEEIQSIKHKDVMI